MTLRLYNTLTRRKEGFKPLDDKNVRMYVCGPTVYDHAHIGNARPVIVFDVLFRLLRHLYGEDHVKYVRNITDVDDKINARAREEGVSIRTLTDRTAAQFHKDIAALGVLEPTVEPRATEHITEMVEIIEKLIAKGHAYAADRHVLFDVPSMKDYGKLSRRPLDEMVAGARVDVAPYKRGDMDFVLWKPSDAETPGWDSPWGRGRPGWHIECSAMSWKHLGETFDIHGGGIDLVFPHHENEVAQTRCAFGHGVMANVWMHNGFLQVEGQKMSKSLGNFVTINELLQSWGGEVLRFNMLTTHYRQPIDWTSKGLEESWRTLKRWQRQLLNTSRSSSGFPTKVLAALSDDLNTPDVLTALHSLSKRRDHVALGAGLNALGFTLSDEALRAPPFNQTLTENSVFVNENKFFGATISQKPSDELVGEKISIRLEARKAKNWAESDRIRDELAAMGIAIKDNKDGTTSWEVKR